MPTPNALRCEIIWRSAGADWAMNVVHFELEPTAVVSQAMSDSLANMIGGNFIVAQAPEAVGLNSQIASTNVLQRINIQDIRVINGDEFSSDILTAGTMAGDQIPDNVSLAVQLKTGPGQSNGRVFQWGFGEGANAAEGRPTGAAINTAVGFWDDIRFDASGTPGVVGMAVQSRTLNGVPRLQPVLHPVTAARRSPSSIARG